MKGFRSSWPEEFWNLIASAISFMHGRGLTRRILHPPSPGSVINVTLRRPRVERAKEVTGSCRPPIDSPTARWREGYVGLQGSIFKVIHICCAVRNGAAVAADP
jgi:hypothetical protein